MSNLGLSLAALAKNSGILDENIALIPAEKLVIAPADLKELMLGTVDWPSPYSANPRPRMCSECPFRYRSEGTAFFSPEQRDAACNRIENLGGFPCHMTDGQTKAFQTEGETKHQCQGWLAAGGDQAAFDRRFRDPSNYRMNVDEMAEINRGATELLRRMGGAA